MCIRLFWANSDIQSRNATFEALRLVRNPFSHCGSFWLLQSILQPQTIRLETEETHSRIWKSWVCLKWGTPIPKKQKNSSCSPTKLPEIGCHVPPILWQSPQHHVPGAFQLGVFHGVLLPGSVLKADQLAEHLDLVMEGQKVWYVNMICDILYSYNLVDHDIW